MIKNVDESFVVIGWTDTEAEAEYLKRAIGCIYEQIRIDVREDPVGDGWDVGFNVCYLDNPIPNMEIKLHTLLSFVDGVQQALDTSGAKDMLTDKGREDSCPSSE